MTILHGGKGSTNGCRVFKLRIAVGFTSLRWLAVCGDLTMVIPMLDVGVAVGF